MIESMSKDSVPVFTITICKSELHQEEHQDEKIPLKLHFEQPLKNPAKPQHSSNPISIPQVTDKRDDSVSRLTKVYDCATWNMYNRIMHHRRMNLKSGARKEYPISVTLSHFLKPKVEGGSKSVQSNTQEIVKTQQECYCRDTKEHDCLQFQLDND